MFSPAKTRKLPTVTGRGDFLKIIICCLIKNKTSYDEIDFKLTVTDKQPKFANYSTNRKINIFEQKNGIQVKRKIHVI